MFAFGTFSFAFALFNGNNQIAGSNYGGNNSVTTTSGQVITTLNASDVLTLRALSTTNLFNMTSAWNSGYQRFYCHFKISLRVIASHI